jgi:hypothetical protein
VCSPDVIGIKEYALMTTGARDGERDGLLLEGDRVGDREGLLEEGDIDGLLEEGDTDGLLEVGLLEGENEGALEGVAVGAFPNESTRTMLRAILLNPDEMADNPITPQYI